jgi:S1-C subfamily serine protease
MRLVRDSLNEPRMGIGSVQDSSGLHVTEIVPGSSAEMAGVQPGDILLAVGGIGADDPTWAAKFRAKYARLPEGTPIPILVRRNGREQALEARLHYVSRVELRLTEDRRASTKARQIREGILRGTTRP